jgi:hypothetical protein
VSPHKLTTVERQIRQNIRNFLLLAGPNELADELAYSLKRNDTFRAECIREIIRENESQP